ncbi:hypothetical protein [Chitinophaga japonensis]|uniref:SWIM-type domain-containing protein n=1 Tax=Chitinophaga japonensis TaxID=104662 RepID=A0A562TDT2_CHIJA|nr:hypothetical protein [Chitinophaga japonensis]TWI91150.1 hypothetical protein LX66_0512 [Chitinophaga japonensis]
MATHKNTKTQSIGLRNSSEPFTIYLDAEPYILTDDALKRQVDERLQRKREWFYPKLKFISMADTTLKMRLTFRDVSHEMTVDIEPDKLHISCTCGQQVETLCLHTYKALERIMGYHSTDYFKEYRPNGLMEIAANHSMYFDRKVTDQGIDVKPKPNLGSVYQLADKMEGIPFGEVLKLPPAPPEQKARDTAITYILVSHFRNRYLTFLLPCLGVLNKSQDNIKAFHHFISGTEKEYDPFLTEDQRTLNKLCYEMWQQVEMQSGSLLESEPGQERSPAGIFGLWEKAMPLLLQQEFIYSYGLYNKRELKGKPQRARIERITLVKDRPHLHFQLLDKGPLYQLQMKVAIRDRNIYKYNTETTFFVEEDKKFYLLASLRDGGIAEWMRRAGCHITVFKEHFWDFEQECLDQLRECYAVTTVLACK